MAEQFAIEFRAAHGGCAFAGDNFLFVSEIYTAFLVGAGFVASLGFAVIIGSDSDGLTSIFNFGGGGWRERQLQLIILNFLWCGTKTKRQLRREEKSWERDEVFHGNSFECPIKNVKTDFQICAKLGINPDRCDMKRLLGSLVFLLLFAGTALADRIDGNWCTGSTQRIEINGPKISLNNRPAFDGQYSRHEFLYTVPAGEDHAGDQVYLRLRGEEDMTSYTIKNNEAVDPVEWKRCQAIS